MRGLTTSLLLVALCANLVVLAVDSDKAPYVGGTITSVKEKAEGTFNTRDEKAIHFTSKSGNLDIPYPAITELEYGQKAGRRVAVAVLVTPLALFSKKRKHYLTLTYNDATGKEQAVVFELGKGIVRTTLTIVETRSGKDIQYQDEEARKAGRG